MDLEYILKQFGSKKPLRNIAKGYGNTFQDWLTVSGLDAYERLRTVIDCVGLLCNVDTSELSSKLDVVMGNNIYWTSMHCVDKYDYTEYDSIYKRICEEYPNYYDLSLKERIDKI